MQRRITIADIAREAGVDKSTVSIVLNRRPLSERIKQETKDRIFEISGKLNYNPSFMARALSSGKTGTLGIVVGDIHTPHFSELVSSALEAADERGYQLLISVTKWDIAKESKALNSLMQRQVDGIIQCPGNLSCDHKLYEHIKKHRYPIVLYNQQLPDMSSVMLDYHDSMNETAALFLAHGHRRVGYIDLDTLNDKEVSFRSSCAEYGLEVVKYSITDNKQNTIELLAKKLVTEDCPRAFLIFSDYAAIQLIARLYDLGMRVPEDVEIIGMGGTEWAALLRPELPSIRFDCVQVMSKAVNMLVEMNEDGNWQPQCIKVPTKLLMRSRDI